MVSYLLKHLNLTSPTRFKSKSAKKKRRVIVIHSRMFCIECVLNPLGVDVSFVVLHFLSINWALSLL